MVMSVFFLSPVKVLGSTGYSQVVEEINVEGLLDSLESDSSVEEALYEGLKRGGKTAGAGAVIGAAMDIPGAPQILVPVLFATGIPLGTVGSIEAYQEGKPTLGTYRAVMTALGAVLGYQGIKPGGVGNPGYIAPKTGDSVIGVLRSRVLDLVKNGNLVGQSPTAVRTIGTGRLRGFTATNTSAAGGSRQAQSLFQALAGRAPSGSSDRFVSNGLEIVYRASGKSGHSKIEVINSVKSTLEKITFLP